MAAKLCLNMIVRNEERIIRRCLDSVAAHIDCWVIGDTGSTDRTPAMIEEFFRERGIPGELHFFPFENFEQARNEALERARASSLNFDYMLLTDADMELVVTDQAFRGRLTAPAYSVLQKTSISYWNDRLVRRDTASRYRGVTHEYLEVPAGRERLEGIHYPDHAEGSSRADKFDRDVRLLREDLARDPDNVRSWFYLAQSYRDNGHWQEAAEAYRHRIKLGGWAEEQWYSRMQLARCLLKLGDDGGFLSESLAAWNARPQRAEPLYELARYHRERGQNLPATLFAEAGLRIPWPDKDVLFIEDWVYKWSLRQEYAICGYYVPEQRERAAEICDALTLSRDAPASAREQARKNLRFYLRPLKELLRSFETAKVDFTPEPSWHAMNPSVVRWNGELWMVQRTVNYTLTKAGDYITADGGPVRTRNFLLRLDQSFAVVHKAEIQPPDDLPPASYKTVLGFEDMRPFVWRGQLWGTATVREQSEAGWNETYLFRIDEAASAAPRLVDWRMLRPRGRKRHEKNWMAAGNGDDMKFIYSVSPTEIIDIHARSLAREPSRWAAEQIRGGSQAIPFGPGWLAVCHEHVTSGRARFYMHRFLWFDRSGKLKHISAPFNLLRPGVEFAVGLAWHPDGKRIVLSFGVGDAESWLGFFSAEDLPPLLLRRSAAEAGTTVPDAPAVVPAIVPAKPTPPPEIPIGANVMWWRRGDAVQNMGDYLSELFIQRLAAAPLLRYPRLRLIGSVLSNFIVQQDLDAAGQPDATVGYWGCGLRDDSPIRAELLARCHFHGVRGPLTRDRLGLPADTPIGDPALLLPLLHRPAAGPRVPGRTICVPHIHDNISDRALMARTGVREIVRPAVPRSIEALLETLDAIATADFVLAGALHAAIIACAYRRPFAYYDSGAIDLPFKWLDFSASTGIPTVFVPTIADGWRAWETLIAPALRRPALMPILEAFPGEIWPEYLARAAASQEEAA